jgi:SOS-response transcriptional repressor LexA
MTALQAKLMAFLREYIDAKGYSPSYQEMADALTVSSKSQIDSVIKTLEATGHIIRDTNRRRSVRPVDRKDARAEIEDVAAWLAFADLHPTLKAEYRAKAVNVLARPSAQ